MAAGSCQENEVGLKTINLLLQAGVHPTATFPPLNKKYSTALMSAIEKHKPHFVQLFIAHHADVNAGESGVTPLGMAKHIGDKQIVALLMKAGAIQ